MALPLDSTDLAAIWLTIELASLTTLLLLLIGTPIAWWLARTRSWLKGPIGAVVALPLVLPPTVIGFYLLVSMGPNGFIGQLTQSLGLGTCPSPSPAWWSARCSTRCPSSCNRCRTPSRRSARNRWRLPRPCARAPSTVSSAWSCRWPGRGFVTAAILGFAHTVGEFGVVLMIGGNIPEKTRVVSVQIFDHVEAMEYAQAHWLAGGMVAFSFVVLLALYSGRRRRPGWPEMDGLRLRFRRAYPGFELDIDLALPGRGVTALFGHSGSGKSTCLRCIAGLEKAAEGEVTINGETWQDSRRNLFVAPHRRALGYVFQDANLFRHLTVRRNLAFGLKRIAAAERRVELEQACALLGIEHLLERMPERLGGEQQRVGIARPSSPARACC